MNHGARDSSYRAFRDRWAIYAGAPVRRTRQRIDFRPVLEGEVFAPLQDLKLFNAVELDPTFGTIQWPNGADFDPEALHDWPKYRDELVAMARQWSETSESVRRTAR